MAQVGLDGCPFLLTCLFNCEHGCDPQLFVELGFRWRPRCASPGLEFVFVENPAFRNLKLDKRKLGGMLERQTQHWRVEGRFSTPHVLRTKGRPTQNSMEASMERPKFTQIAGTATALYALDSNGHVWTYVPPIPPYEGHTGLGDWWKLLQMRTEYEVVAEPTRQKK